MAWTYLVIAGLFECAWAMVISFWLLSLAMRFIPIGTAYAVWTGIGAVGVAVLGMVIFGESRDIMRVICLLLIVSGILGLKLVSSI